MVKRIIIPCLVLALMGVGTVLFVYLRERVQFDRLMQDENAVIDITSIDPARLPARVKAKKLVTNAKAFKAPALQNLEGSLEAPQVTVFDAPALVNVSGHLDLPVAVELDIPVLKNVSDYLNADAATDFRAPKLQYSGTIRVRSAKSFEVPVLEIVSGEIDARMSKNFDAQMLQTTRGFINADSVENFSAPKLKETDGNIFVFMATNFDAPFLKHVNAIIDARNVKVFKAPALETAIMIYAPKAAAFVISPMPQSPMSYYTEKMGSIHCFPALGEQQAAVCTNSIFPPNPEDERCREMANICGIQLASPDEEQKTLPKNGFDIQHVGDGKPTCDMRRCEFLLTPGPALLKLPAPPPPCGMDRQPLVPACPEDDMHPPVRVSPGDNSL